MKPLSAASRIGSCKSPSCSRCPPTGEEVEPRARHLGTALHVDQTQRLAEFQVIFRVVDRGRFTDEVEDGVVILPTGRHAVDDHVRDRHLGSGARRLGFGLLGLGRLDLLGQLLGPLQQRRTLVGGGRAHLLAGGLLFGAQRIGCRNRRPPGGIGCQQRVDQGWVLASTGLGPAHGVGVFAEQLQVDHGLEPYAGDARQRQPHALLLHQLSRGPVSLSE